MIGLGADFISDMLNQTWGTKARDMAIWLTKDGKYLPITAMSNSHISNTFKMLERNGDEYGYISVFKQTLKNRRK